MTNPLDVLWGAIIDELDLDITAQVAVVLCHETEGSRTTSHRIEFRNVSQFQFHNSIPGPWDYAELTEIRVSTTLSERMQTEIIFWSDEASLSIVADSVMLDGESVKGGLFRQLL
jgi:hypothetical protein